MESKSLNTFLPTMGEQYIYSRQTILDRINKKKEAILFEDYSDHYDHDDYSVYIGPDSDPWG